MIDIFTFTKLIQLTEFLDGIQQFVTVVGGWIIDISIPFALPLTCEKLDYYFIGYYKKAMNGYKRLLEAIMFSPFFFRNKNA